MASKRTLAKRDAQIKTVSRLIDEAKGCIEGDNSKDILIKDDVSVMMRNILVKKQSIEAMNDEIIDAIDEEKIEEEIEAATTVTMKIDRSLLMIERYIEKLEIRKIEEADVSTLNFNGDDSRLSQGRLDEPTRRTQTEGPSSEVVEKTDNDVLEVRNGSRRPFIKLPDIAVKKFFGDPVSWPEFKETFFATVGSHPNLSEIEKLTYLKSYLGGDAERCVEGINLTAQNYAEVLKILEERFGNKQLIISKHMEQLLKLERVNSSNNIKGLRGLYDKINVHLRSLSSFDVDSTHFGPMLIPVVLEKLPSDIELEMNRRMNKKKWRITDVLDILKDELEARESCEATASRSNHYLDKSNGSRRNFSGKGFTTEQLFTSNVNVKGGTQKCAFCNQGHFSDKCTVVTNVNARKEIAIKKRLCFKCLKSSHMIRNCISKHNCYKCKSNRHHTAICEPKSAEVIPAQQQFLKNVDEKSDQNENKQTTNLVATTRRNAVLLQTVQTKISDVKDLKTVEVKVIFDSGSQRTYITQRIADILNLFPSGTEKMTIHAFGDKRGKFMEVPEYDFGLKGPKGECFYLKGYAVPNICAPLKDQRRDILLSQFEVVRNLVPANVWESSSDEIDVLIGADYYWSMMSEEFIRLDEKLVMIKSKLGYLFSGPVDISNGLHDSVNCVHAMNVMHTKDIRETTMILNDDITMNEQVEKFWNLDQLGIAEGEQSVYEKCEADIQFKDNRYEVRLPFKEYHPIIEDNYNLSLGRLRSLKRKLEKQPEIMKEYEAVIKQQLQEGILEKIRPDEKQPEVGEVAYLPHQAVVRENKTTTKVRVVMDASASKAGSTSLNDCMYKGPCLTPLIFDTLLRFRLHNIAITADIERAYLQISIVPEQRNLLRILWYDDVFAENPVMEVYRFTRLIFGARPSQYLLNAVVNKHAEKFRNSDPDFVAKVRRGFYVDDLNTGVNSITEGTNFYHKCKSRFAEANFHLRKWRTNDAMLTSIISKSEGTSNENFGGKVLGVDWDDVTDDLCIKFDDVIPDDLGEKVTKRSILRVIAGFFDPLGLIQPVVIQMKIIFQEVCCLKQDWDVEVPCDVKEKWLAVLNMVRQIKHLIVPRAYCKADVEDPVERVELHGFGDASFSAYGCCVYLKYIFRSGRIKVSLVCSKSRVAPIKSKQTIPRLELLGSLVLARLVVSVLDCFKMDILISKVCCYTDSKICLAWIHAVGDEFSTFVENRLIEIRSKVEPNNWYYCPTEQNPADIITRVNVKNLSNEMWLNGPPFLGNEGMITASETSVNIRTDESYMKELKKAKVSKTTQKADCQSNVIHNELRETVLLSCKDESELSLSATFNIEKYRDILKLFRVTAYVLRFLSYLRKEKNVVTNHRYFKAEEIKRARKLWIAENQRLLKDDAKFQELKVHLNIVEDDEGVLRACGRMRNACLPYETKAPIVLKRDHYLANLIVWYCHTKVLHNGAKQTVTEIRSCYWIGKVTQFVKKLVHRCFVCRKLNSRPFSYPGHSDLPTFRFDDLRAFNSTGVDLAGPVMVLPVFKPKDKLHKVHIVLYTCASTRGVVLDVVDSTDAPTFVNSFKRFIARRGAPSLMVSDNGSNFTAAETQTFASSKEIEWKFNLQLAAWWGGMWERLISMVKACIKKTVGVKTLTYVELQTLLSGIEVILNNRPLCQPDDEDVDILTPNHLLFGGRLELNNESKKEVECTSSNNDTLVKRQRHLAMMKDHFFKRWKNEYLTALRNFHKSTRKSAGNINVGDVVILKDEKLPRHRWNLCKVVDVVIGRDGVNRGARVKIGKTGAVVGRPLNKLYPLEVLSDRM